MTLKKVGNILLVIIVFAIIILASLGYKAYKHLTSPEQQRSNFEMIGMYHLPIGEYRVLSVTNKGFVDRDMLTNMFVYEVESLSSREHLYVKCIMDSESAYAVGDKLRVTTPGNILPFL